ncbi:homoserine kinase [Campylobacter blaseri]|uniref:Homoserine kinase n=1 Tax=Campylobacter blaseri TaxID=2042961 RepID=A0A2P8QZA4_9BACT|nr:homoserine kinase [Campylobacter blaseri]PSM51576.1 homoserine kinase [Campylobacter blaseri]PSM53369.1 homoserine kinase [Campylobacter blaseri]QKF86664.1 homoserine kinase [Campylobacter blaseri]
MNIIVPATSANLGPGFDVLGLSLKLYNKVEITRQKITSISIKGEGCNNIYLKKNNTFVKIFNEIYLELTGKTDNFKFNFLNNIPLSRGLGSSSSVIIGAIASAYEMAGFKVKKETILNKALTYENHPDNIAPAVFGGFTVSIIDDFKVYTQKAQLSDKIQAIVVIPNKPMSTNKSRAKLPKHYTAKDSVLNVAYSSFLTSCFIKQDYDNLKITAKDKFHEDIRMKNLPELFDVKKLAYENGSLMSTLSGSGSSFLNIAYKEDSINLQEKLRSKFKDFRVEIIDFDNIGFKILTKS